MPTFFLQSFHLFGGPLISILHQGIWPTNRRKPNISGSFEVNHLNSLPYSLIRAQITSIPQREALCCILSASQSSHFSSENACLRASNFQQF